MGSVPSLTVAPSGDRRLMGCDPPRFGRRPTPRHSIYARRRGYRAPVARPRMSRWPPPRYRITVEFEAPLPFVFRWCTDYRTDDAKRAGETYDRRILRRTRHEVLYEDLWWAKDGWRWRRTRVRLRPPDRWHADSVGNIRDARIDYRLTQLPQERTRLTLEMRRRPAPGRGRQPSRRALESELRSLWGRYRRALERDLGSLD